MSFKLLENEGFKHFFKENAFTRATDTQKESIEPILSGKSSYILAPTGSGKTLAFLLPLFDLLKKNDQPNNAKTRAVILTPTRELNQQVFSEAKKISHHVKLKVRKLSGGATKMNGDIVISTMKTFLDSIRKKRIDVSDLEFIICDEADQMFEGGFEREMNIVLDKYVLPKTQILFFSATHSFELDLLFKNHEKLQKINKIVLDNSFRIKKEIQTINIQVANEKKQITLKTLLKDEIKTKAICFFNKKDIASEYFEYMTKELADKKIFLIHGGLLRVQRDKAIKEFRASKKGILFTSDILSRGIDIRDLDIVVNVSLPKNSVYYLHRIGRVARMKDRGTVLNFVTQKDEKIIGGINKSIKEQTILNVNPITVKTRKKKKATKRTSEAYKKPKKITKRSSLPNRNSKSAPTPIRGSKKVRPRRK